MKHLTETFTDSEFEQLQAAKGDRTWREFLLTELTEDTDE